MALSPEHKQMLETLKVLEGSGYGQELVAAAQWLFALSPDPQERIVVTSPTPEWVMHKMPHDKWYIKKELTRLVIDVSQDRLTASLGRLREHSEYATDITTAVLETRQSLDGQTFSRGYVVASDAIGRPLPVSPVSFNEIAGKVVALVDAPVQEDVELVNIESFAAISDRAA